MDLQRDYLPFKKLITRLCETLGKPVTDELVESWWKALRHVDLASVERRVDEFLGKASGETRFPRPAQMRDPTAVPAIQSEDTQNYHRGYWRSAIVGYVGGELGLSFHELERVIIDNRDSLGLELLQLLNEIVVKDHDNSRSDALHAICAAECSDIAFGHRSLGRAA